MYSPPHGYDDPTVVPQKQLKLWLDRIEGELLNIQTSFKQHPSDGLKIDSELEKDFGSLRNTADELGGEYLFLIENLIVNYDNFKKAPDTIKLEGLLREVKSVDLLLAS